ncbi:MAG TPA: hypothetical protein PLN52_24160 [Opitutaceae bacterium]|nr:hypothetical protein [Opitutaceae bacterium]
MLSYCESAGVPAHGIWHWTIRFAYWIPLSYIFYAIYIDFCRVNSDQGVLLGVTAALITGVGGYIESRIFLLRRKPNKAVQRTSFARR